MHRMREVCRLEVRLRQQSVEAHLVMPHDRHVAWFQGMQGVHGGIIDNIAWHVTLPYRHLALWLNVRAEAPRAGLSARHAFVEPGPQARVLKTGKHKMLDARLHT